MTTGGGLYRYDLGDEVEVTGFVQQCPTLRFLGRSGRTSDVVGEKLSESHVAAAVNDVVHRLQLRPAFVLLAPLLGTPPHYCLYLQGIDECAARLVGKHFGERLAENPYYAHAVDFGQLGPLEVVLLAADASPWSLYEEQGLQRGQRAGNIKPAVLDRGTHWHEVFAPLRLQLALPVSRVR